MSVDPAAGESIVAPGSTTSHVEVTIQTTVIQPARRAMFPVYKNDVELCLRKHLQRVEAIDWKTPGVALGTIVLTLVTSHFHDTVKVPAAVWAAGYGFAGFLCIFYLAKACWKWWKHRPMTLQQLVEEIIKSDPC